MGKHSHETVKNLDGLKEAKMTGGDELNAVYRDAFLVHASLTEITIDFGTLNRYTLDGKSEARERLVMPPPVAMHLIQSLQMALKALQERVGELSREQQNNLGGDDD